MRLDGISAYAPEQVWSNVRVAARLRLERMRLSAQLRAEGNGQLGPEQAKLFQTSDRWVRRFIGFTERRFCREGEGTVDLAASAARQLFERSGHAPAEIDAAIVASVGHRRDTPPYVTSANTPAHASTTNTFKFMMFKSMMFKLMMPTRRSRRSTARQTSP